MIVSFPWNEPPLDEWAIVGMNHYHVEDERHLFVAMTKAGCLIKAEGADESAVFRRLKKAASEMGDPRAFVSDITPEQKAELLKLIGGIQENPAGLEEALLPLPREEE